MPRNSNKSRGVNGGGCIRHKTVKANDKTYDYHEAKVTVGYDPVTGKQIHITGKSKQDVRRRMNEMIVAVDQGAFIDKTRQTLQEWMDEWFETFVVYSIKNYTADSYRTIMKCHIFPALGSIRISDLTPTKIQQFYNQLLIVKGLSPKTVKNVHGVLHKALEKAKTLRMIPYNPTEACELPRVEKSEITPLDQEGIKALLKELSEEKYSIVYEVTLFTGMRQGEVLGLTWDCVDFEKQTINIKKQLIKTHKVNGEYVLESTKNGKSRVIHAGSTVMGWLREQQQQQAEMANAAGSAWNNAWNLVFTNELGGHLCHFTVYRRFKEIVRKIGLSDVRFHDLRHSFAVVCLEAGVDIKTLQGELGHATTSFTLDTYAHITELLKHQAADRVENYIQSIK